MYLPEMFRHDDREALLALATSHPFATVVSRGAKDGFPTVSHLPLLVDGTEPERVRLRGHLARENPQYADFAAGADVVAIFHGPHGYVSPSVYEQHPSVPTWNYVVVHARGVGRLVDEAGLRGILEDSVARFDRTGWRIEGDEEFVRSRLAAIAGFEIAVADLLGKWKVSQNRSVTEQARIAAWLEGGDAQSQALAAMMRARAEGAEKAEREPG
jgi:transcriptional regulator